MIAISNTHIKQFLGIGDGFQINNEDALFQSPNEMEVDEPFADQQQSPPMNYGEDLHNDDIFKDAFSPI